MSNDILLGLGMLLLGIFFVWDTKKHPTKGKDIWHLDFKGYLGGIGCIVLGVGYLLKGLWQWWISY